MPRKAHPRPDRPFHADALVMSDRARLKSVRALLMSEGPSQT